MDVRTRGWGGDPPQSEDEAIRRVLDASRACIDRDGAEIGIVDVARELGVTRQTVYRYFRTTEDLLTWTALDAAAAFLQRFEDHLRQQEWTPAGAVVEGIAYTLEQLPREPYLGMLLAPGRISIFSRGLTSETSLALGRAMIERFPVAWSAHGFSDQDLDELVECMLRMVGSFLEHPGTPPRTGDQLRQYLARWLAPAIMTHPTTADDGRSDELRAPDPAPGGTSE
ncbi:MAG TPA: TetR/AcrR family transcriptional regulator [Acidimicrobiales bacterium]